MGLSINQNIAAFNSYRNLSATQGSLGKSLEKLSSGFRINRAADDAAGLAISEGLRSQVGGLKVASRNAQDGISVVQTAEGALTETHAILQRMRDLSVQAANHGGLSTKAKDNIQAEMNQLQQEVTRIADTTQFNGTKLLDGAYNGTFQVGANVGESISVSVKSSLHSSGALTSQGLGIDALVVNGSSAPDNTSYVAGATVGSQTGEHVSAAVTSVAEGQTLSISIGNKTLSIVGGTGGTTAADGNLQTALRGEINQDANSEFKAALRGGSADSLTVNVATGVITINAANANDTVTITNNGTGVTVTPTLFNASTLATNDDYAPGVDKAIKAIDKAITEISTVRANLGAVQNRFEHTINNLNVAVENLSASESRIRDTDMASEMVNFTRNQILSQAGTAMLAQANQIPQGVLSLLR